MNVNSWFLLYNYTFLMRQCLEPSHCDSEEQAFCVLATYLEDTALPWYERGMENRQPGFPGGPLPVDFANLAVLMQAQLQSQAVIQKARLQQLTQQLTQPETSTTTWRVSGSSYCASPIPMPVWRNL